MGAAQRLWLGLGVVGLSGWMSAAMAAGPWDKLLTVNRVEADPQKTYALADKNGPWMISACSFAGQDAQQQARELVYELRKRYKLPAYTYEKKFEFGQEAFGRGVDRFGAPLRMKYRGGPEIEEIAVLVGDYASVDDPEAQETLRKIKYYEPECLTPREGRRTARSLAPWRWIQREVLTSGNERQRGPMAQAFMTTNDLLPKEYFVPKGIDELVLKANEGVEHCLLDCPGKYTVQVAHFTGQVIIKQEEIAAIEKGRKEMESQLVEAAEKAHRLTQALRMKGYEAYEFHDRYASIVTVGSYDWAKRTTPDGQDEINPSVIATIEQFRGKASQAPGHQGEIGAQTLLGIPFDIQPIPVHVPRRSVAAAYARDAVGP